MDFDSPHFKKFQEIELPSQSGWSGNSPLEWYRWVLDHSLSKKISGDIEEGQLQLSGQIPKEKLNRSKLFDLISDQEILIETCVICILAWGGMKRKHGASLFERSKFWLPIASDIRNGKVNRLDAYQRFSELKASGHLPGMGPAYFTKLIYFLGEPTEPRGYIMDQWTARSVNLLINLPIVKTTTQKVKSKKKGNIRIEETVTDANTKDNYDAFCKAIEAIAQKLNISPCIVEERMFSEGRGKGGWRNYVIAQKINRITLGIS